MKFNHIKILDDNRFKAWVHKTSEPYYLIGVDTADKEVMVYSLIRKVGEISEVLLCNKSKDEVKFNQDVKLLAQIFNAEILRWDGK